MEGGGLDNIVDDNRNIPPVGTNLTEDNRLTNDNGAWQPLPSDIQDSEMRNREAPFIQVYSKRKGMHQQQINSSDKKYRSDNSATSSSPNRLVTEIASTSAQSANYINNDNPIGNQF